jgi:hypothetical protein
MYPQPTVDMALHLSAIGILDRENARICNVSVAAIRHWRCGRRRASHGGSRHRANCPRCHERTMDESAYSYLLGLYLGDGSITRGRRDVYTLWLACCDDWPGLMMAARRAMSDVMPASSVFCVHRTGCTMVKSTSKHWPCLFPQHGPGRKHNRKIELAQWQLVIVKRFPGEFARGLSILTAGGVSIGYGEGSPAATAGTSIHATRLPMSPRTSSGFAARSWTISGWPGGSRGRTPYP